MNKHMRKGLIVLTLVIITLFYSNSVEAAIDYEDYSADHTYPNETLEKQVKVYSKDGNYDKGSVQASIDILEKLNPHIIEIIKVKEIEIVFVDFPIPDIEGLEFLDEREEVPGYPEGSTYRDDVFGLYNGNDEIKLAITRLGNFRNRNIAETTLHEIGHAVSFGDSFSDYFTTSEFRDFHREEKPVLFPDDDYYDNVKEYFAEIFKYYYCNDEQKSELKEKAPKSFQYMDDFLNYPLYVTSNTIDGVELTWSEIEGAVKYEVVRDDVVIDTIEEATYLVNAYDDYYHHYNVNPLAGNGNEIFHFLGDLIETKLLEKQELETEQELLKIEKEQLEHEEEMKRQEEEWKKEQEEKTTLEDIFIKYNIPTSLLPVIIWTTIILVVFGIPTFFIVTIFLVIRRKKKKKIKQAS